MTVIYSAKRIEGLDGRYIDPRFYAGVVKCGEVHTDDQSIKKDYEVVGVSVSPITKKRSRAKK